MKTDNLEGLIWNGQVMEMPTPELELNLQDSLLDDDMVPTGGTFLASVSGSPNAGMTLPNSNQSGYSELYILDDKKDYLKKS